MTPERWQQVKDLLQSVLELEPSKRAAFVAQSCNGDQELRQVVESLLAADDSPASDKKLSEFLKQPVFAAPASMASGEMAEVSAGRWVGPYKIIEQIGAGGMGEVYRAVRDDDQYRKQVAIKLVRTGQDSALVVSRFKNERQILASLDHPNIARLLDGGTTKEGAAYFVMELIEGQPIDQHCIHYRLLVTERLKLFLQICAAVQYAHQRLIIHRDIKPGNILVTSDGVPKLLDFGIAKLLDVNAEGGQAEATMTLFRVLTPAYASPEQVKGEPITTASDVYSLGVVLYELLTGSSPYRGTSHTPQEMVQAVCEFEPERPSTALRRATAQSKPESAETSQASTDSVDDTSVQRLSKRLRGDLDNIVLMALRKEPDRRYASVEQFAEDIRRHLANLPVIARKGTARYRASKFLTRHKAGIAATAAIVFILLASLVVTLREARVARQQAEVARQQRARAERRFNDVRKLANSLMFDIHDSIRDLPGATAARKLLVTQALQYLDSLSQESSGDPSLQRELAAAYDRMGDVLGYAGAANLGDTSGALQSYRKALTIRESLVASSPGDLSAQHELVNEFFRITFALENEGDFPGALNNLQQAEPFMRRIAANNTDSKVRDGVAGLYFFTANILQNTGNLSGALENYRQAASIHESIAGDPTLDPLLKAHLIGDYNGIVRVLVYQSDAADAVATSNKALSFIKQLSDSNPTNATLREYVAETLSIHRSALAIGGDLKGALDDAHRELELYKQLLASDPANTLARNNVSLSGVAMGDLLVSQGRISEGMRVIRQVLTEAQARTGGQDRYASVSLAAAYGGMGKAYAAQAAHDENSADQVRDWRQARSWYQKSSQIWGEPRNREIQDDFGKKESDDALGGIAQCDSALAELHTKP